MSDKDILYHIHLCCIKYTNFFLQKKYKENIFKNHEYARIESTVWYDIINFWVRGDMVPCGNDKFTKSYLRNVLLRLFKFIDSFVIVSRSVTTSRFIVRLNFFNFFPLINCFSWLQLAISCFVRLLCSYPWSIIRSNLNGGSRIE